MKTRDCSPLSSETVWPRVLLLDEDTNFCHVLRSWLARHRYAVTIVHRGADGLRELLNRDFDAIVCDTRMKGMSASLFHLAVSRIKHQLSQRFVFIGLPNENPELEDFGAKKGFPVSYKPLATDDLLEKILLATTQPHVDEDSKGSTVAH